MKKVLILGAGRGQIPVIELCKKLNCQVSVASPEGNYPGFKLADKCIFEDVQNKEKLLEYAEQNGIQGVLTDQLDEGVSTAAYICEKLGLPGIGYDTALKFTNKYIMRQEASKAGICVPGFVMASSVHEAVSASSELRYPLVIKPVDSSASRGIVKVNEPCDLEFAVENALRRSFSKKVILEEFIQGVEFVAESYTHDYVTTNLMVGFRTYFNVENAFIPSSTVFCDALSSDRGIEHEIQEANRKLVSSFGLKFGITHGEFIYSPVERKVYLVEIAARGGGVFISSDLIPLTCGVNANQLLVNDALGISQKSEIVLRRGAAGYFCYLLPRGKIASISGVDAVSKIPGVHHAYFDNIAIGMEILDARDKSARKGPVIIFGKTKENCMKTAESVRKTLRIEILTESGVQGIIWD